MAGSISDYLEKELLDHTLKVGSYAQPTVYMALGTAMTGDDHADFTECTAANGYARIATAWNAASSRQVTNNGALTFPQASGSWGTVTHWALYDGDVEGSGNMLAWGQVVPSRAIGDGDTPEFADTVIQVEFNAHVSNVGISDTLAHDLLDHAFEGTAYTQETNLYVGFGTTPLTDSGTITGEATGGGYARIINNSWDAATGDSPSLCDNTSSIDFTVSGDWTASLDVVFIANTLSGTTNADLMFFGTITSFSALDGDTVSILAGDLDVTMA